MKMGVSVYWRFKGEKVWKYGWPIQSEVHGLIRMGLHNGDHQKGPVVLEEEIEWKEFSK